jgi:hypothetical protein
MKLGRSYEIQLKPPGGDELITIKPPISLVCEVDRHIMATANTGSFTLYNLSENTRGKVYKDKYDTLTKFQIIVMAGYGETELWEIFKGNIIEAYSYKENTEWITKIEAQDASYAIQNAFMSETIAKDTPKADVIERIIHTMPDMIVGFLGANAQGASADRGKVLVGPSYDILGQETDGNQFVDGGVVNVLAPDEAISGDVFILGEDNLFETPRRRETFLEVETLFSPEIRVGYLVEIQGKEKRFNGQYRADGINHSLTISGASAGDAITTLSLNCGAKAFKLVAQS